LQLVPPSKHNIIDKNDAQKANRPRRSLQASRREATEKATQRRARDAVHQIANPQGGPQGPSLLESTTSEGVDPLKWPFSKGRTNASAQEGDPAR
jgi:hypothetical protein